MSIRAIQAVWDRTAVGGSTRLLLLALADFADEDGYSWPNVQTLAHRTGRGERQVQRLIGMAIDAGELSADRSGGRGSSRYRLSPGGEPVGMTSMSPLGRHRRHPTDDTGDTPGMTPATPEPSLEPPTEPSSERARDNELQDAEQRLRDLATAGPNAEQLAGQGDADPVVRYHELTARFPSERIREWLNDTATQWGDARTADALTEAFARDRTHRGLITRAVDVMNEHEHETERANRTARAAAGTPARPEQSDEERARILEENRQRAREARGRLLADGLVHPTRPGDEELQREELERREGATQ